MSGRYPVMSYSAAHRWEAEAKRRGVSQVARSSRGFLRAYQRAGSWAKLPEAWKRRRDAFVARHMAQVRQGGEKLWKDGKPSRRALALIMWAYMPPRGNPGVIRPGTGHFVNQAKRREGLKQAQQALYEKTGQWLTLDEVEALLVEAHQEIEAKEVRERRATFRVAGGRMANPRPHSRRGHTRWVLDPKRGWVQQQVRPTLVGHKIRLGRSKKDDFVVLADNPVTATEGGMRRAKALQERLDALEAGGIHWRRLEKAQSFVTEAVEALAFTGGAATGTSKMALDDAEAEIRKFEARSNPRRRKARR